MKEILFWTSHKQYSSDLAEVIRLFFADAHVSLADKREDAWLRHDLRFDRAVGGILPSAAEWFPKIFFPYNPMIF